MSHDDSSLSDIQKAGRLILDFTQDMDWTAFEADLKTQSAVLHQLLVMGEAVKRLSPTFRAQHTYIPWPLIAGMRDHLIHGYDAVDLDEVWRTVRRDIPALLQAISEMTLDGS